MFTNKPTDLQKLTAPVWEGDTVYEESFFPLLAENEDEESTLEIPLLYPVTEILSVTTASREETLKACVDYRCEDGKLIIPGGSAVRRFAEKDYHIVGEGEDKFPFAHRDGGKIFFGEGDTMHSREYLVTYRHAGSWDGFVPTGDAKKLPRTKALLKAGKPVSFCYFGDSITTGANSSGAIGFAPYIPMFPELVSMVLEEKFGSDIHYVNHARGGMVSKWGTENLPAMFAEEKPDIMFIAFGMNDATGRVTPEAFMENTRIMVEQTKALNPDCEFLLCSTTMPNPMAPLFVSDHAAHEPLLAAFCEELGDCAALVPMTSVHQALMEHKRFFDMSGNNINHPCDFLARVYAQTILAQLL